VTLFCVGGGGGSRVYAAPSGRLRQTSLRSATRALWAAGSIPFEIHTRKGHRWVTLLECGGGGRNWTGVRQTAAFGSTCL